MGFHLSGGQQRAGRTWLEVAVEESPLMDVRQALQDGGAPLTHQCLGQQPLAGLHELVEIALLQGRPQ